MTQPDTATAPPDAVPDRFTAAVLAAALRRIEDSGPLDDAAALQRAFAGGGNRAQQVARRNALLGERLGLLAALAHWRTAGVWLVAGLALVMALAGLAAARGVLAPDRSINAVAAVLGVLALPTLTLLAWLAGFFLARRRPVVGGFSFGHLVLALLARLPLGAGAHATQLLHAALDVMRRRRLWLWFSGVVSHAVWLLALLLTAAGLMFGFAFRAYNLSWETTILSAGFFEHFVAISGWVPKLLGFAVPDAAAVQQVAYGLDGTGAAWAAPAAQRAWALWLLGCIAVYGLLPRLVLFALSIWRWRRGIAQLALVDLTDPYNQRLVRRLDALAPAPQVVDPEIRPSAPPRSRALGPTPAMTSAPARSAPARPLVLGFELPEELHYSPPQQPTGVDALCGIDALCVDGSATARQQALQRILATPPTALLVLVYAPASPDRGTARFLRDLAPHAARLGLWPVASARDIALAFDADHADADDGIHEAPDVDRADTSTNATPNTALNRWRDWLQAQTLPRANLLPDAAAVARWLYATEPQT